MKKVSIVVPNYMQENRIFDSKSPLNRDNIFDKYIELKQSFASHGWDTATDDINTPTNSDVIIYFDMPNVLPTEKDIEKSYLIIVETDLIRPDNYDKKRHRYFSKIFSWHDDLVDNTKYFKLNCCHRMTKSINKDRAIKEKLCVLIAGNKDSPTPNKNELYSKRKEAIRWFEQNHIDNFSLYGIGWDRYTFKGPVYFRALNRIPVIKSLGYYFLGEKFSSYKGIISNKKEVMQKYKFSICFENIRNIPGYISEKIFDSFFASCVPVYWGANNITEYIPEKCFIDMRDFNSYEELYEFLNAMSEEKYQTYLDNIELFLQDSKSDIFSSTHFGDQLASVILNGKNFNSI